MSELDELLHDDGLFDQEPAGASELDLLLCEDENEFHQHGELSDMLRDDVHEDILRDDAHEDHGAPDDSIAVLARSGRGAADRPAPKPKGRPPTRAELPRGSANIENAIVPAHRDYADIVAAAPPEQIPIVTESVFDIVRLRYIRNVPTILATYLEQCVAFAVSPKCRVDDKAANVAIRLCTIDLANAARHPDIIQKDFKVSRKTYSRQRAVLAQLCFDLDVASRLTFDKQLITAPNIRALHLFEIDLYDETPMPITLRDKIESSCDAQVLADLVRGMWSKWSEGTFNFRESGPAKLFQVESQWSALFAIEMHGAQHIGFFVGRGLSNLQCFDRVTGATTRQGVRQIWSTNGFSHRYEQRCRASCTDRGGSNGACERGIRQQDRPDWQHMHLDCHAHLVALVFGRAFKHYEYMITGMIRVALATEIAGTMSHFRRCLKTQIRSMIRFVVGDPDPEDTAHMRRVLAMYARTGEYLVERLVVLRMLPNGNWRNRDRIYVYCERMPANDVEELAWADRLVSGLSFAVCPRKFKKYARNRWFGKEVAIDQFGLLEHCHGLFSSTVKRWVAEVDGASKSKASGAKRPREPEVASDLLPLEDGAAALPICDDPGVDHGGADAAAFGEADGGDLGGAGGDPAGAVQASARAEDATKEKVNSEHRQMSLKFASQNFLPEMDIMRVVMVPVMEMFREYDRLGGDDWEHQQQVKEADSRRSGFAGHRMAIRGASRSRFFWPFLVLL